MFLHLGGDYNIPIRDIVFIIDVESTLQSKYSRDFFELSEKKGAVVKVNQQEPKSIIVTQFRKKGIKTIPKTVIYYSPISSLTLLKRAGFINSASLETEVI